MNILSMDWTLWILLFGRECSQTLVYCQFMAKSLSNPWSDAILLLFFVFFVRFLLNGFLQIDVNVRQDDGNATWWQNDGIATKCDLRFEIDEG